MLFANLIGRIIDEVALRGRAGARWSELVEMFDLKSSVIQKNILIHLVRVRFFSVYPDVSNERHIPDQTIVIAPLHEIWKALGVSSADEAVMDDQIFTALELLGRERGNGCFITDISKFLNLKLVHPLVDKLVSNNLAIKRIVAPIRKSTKAIISTRTNIIHLRRFSPDYDPAIRGLKFEAGDEVKNHVCDLILEKLINKKVEYLAASDVAKLLNIGYRDMISFRTQIVGSAKLFKIKFFEVELSSVHSTKISRSRTTNPRPNLPEESILESVKKIWCVSRNLDYFDDGKNVLSTTNSLKNCGTREKIGTHCFINMPYYHQGIYHLYNHIYYPPLSPARISSLYTTLSLPLRHSIPLQSSKVQFDLSKAAESIPVNNGLSGPKLLRLLGAHKKRNARLISDLNTRYMVTGRKCQEGKQTMFKLFPSVQASPHPQSSSSALPAGPIYDSSTGPLRGASAGERRRYIPRVERWDGTRIKTFRDYDVLLLDRISLLLLGTLQLQEIDPNPAKQRVGGD